MVCFTTQFGHSKSCRARVSFVDTQLHPDFSATNTLTKIRLNDPRRTPLKQQGAKSAFLVLVCRLRNFSFQVAHLHIGDALVISALEAGHNPLPVAPRYAPH
ncbi:hypothetical protein D3C71_1788120 [compost metagenome]